MLGKTALGSYRLLRHLGRGSNATVFLAESLREPGKQVVVKRIHDHVTTHARFRQMFEAEVRSMANFVHPYAVRLLGASLDDPLGPCLVMEYVPGLTLDALLEKHKRLSIDRVGRLMGYLGHALQAAHDAGIVHRDLKPANLMVVNAGQASESLKVMDFGFAGFAAKPHIQLAELTGHGPIYAIGTPGYVSPEMIRGDRVDGRSDVYSVGVILFEMLTGRLPFDYTEQDQLLAAHVKDPPPQFRKIGFGDIPPGIEGVVQLALAKYPNERQQSAREIVEGFSHALRENLWASTAPREWQPSEEGPVVRITPASRSASKLPSDPFRVASVFEVAIPERLAAAKLRGFVDDLGGHVVASDPGLIVLRVGLPAGYKPPPTRPSGLFGWLATLRQPGVTRGQEPIEVELLMEKPNPSLARLRVAVACRPIKDYLPQNLAIWRDRCDKLHTTLRLYLGAS